MNILYYALPCFLYNIESSKYCASHLNALLSYNNSSCFNSTIIKENIISTSHLDSEYFNAAPHIELLDFSLDNKKSLIEYIDKNKINIYHCFHNGFSLTNNDNVKKVSTIYTTLPLFFSEYIDSNYKNLYLARLDKTIKFSDNIIVPYNFMKTDLCNYFSLNSDLIEVIPPSISFDLLGRSKALSRTYVKGKFNIYKDYYIYVGEINSRNTLIDTIKLFNSYSRINDSILILALTYLPKNKNIYIDLVKYIDSINLSSNVVFLNNLSYIDIIDLINGSICFINLNPCNELNLTSLYALFLKTKILAYQNQSNLEYLEDYPIYISDLNHGFNIDTSNYELLNDYEILDIANKFNPNLILDSLLDVYNL
ncbi:glycosyltransferase [Clostridium paraputrificum]|uniref:glycosyltransferase n=1 Tax=Clostridium TaxID=1485 RepID=UPI003D3544E2